MSSIDKSYINNRNFKKISKMQNQASPIPARRQLSQSTTGQAPKTSSLSSGSPSPIRRAPPSYESIRQSPEKSGKIQVPSISLPMIHKNQKPFIFYIP